MRAGLDLLIAAGNELNNTDIVPFLHAQSSAYALPEGQQIEVSKTWQTIDPFNRHGLYKLGVQLDERWFGDSEQQLALAEYIAINAPEGHEGLVVVPELVMERWEYLTAFQELDEDDADERTVELKRVRNFLRLAYQKLFKSGHPVDERLVARHLSYFAWWFYWGDEDKLAYEIFQQLKGRAYAPVWEFRDDDDAIESYNDTRDYLIEEIEFGDED